MEQQTEKEQQELLMNYRIAYLGDTMVNWCPQLGITVLNDRARPLFVEATWWSSAKCANGYVFRLMHNDCWRLDKIAWSDSLKETQRNWIGRSEGAVIHFKTSEGASFDIFTTRADTIFGVTFMVLAPKANWCRSLQPRHNVTR